MFNLLFCSNGNSTTITKYKEFSFIKRQIIRKSKNYCNAIDTYVVYRLTS